MTKPLGIHVLYDLWNCSPELLDDPERLKEMLLDAVHKAEMTPLESVFHQYTPQGVSVVVLVAESHISIHTWPEFQYAAVDFFSCRIEVDPKKVQNVLQEVLQPERIEVQSIERGKSDISFRTV